jgi:hypothetical protein
MGAEVCGCLAAVDNRPSSVYPFDSSRNLVGFYTGTLPSLSVEVTASAAMPILNTDI